ncbi:hypothetical protein CISIN_1g0034111mg, partial [Citrus sinensis]
WIAFYKFELVCF